MSPEYTGNIDHPREEIRRDEWRSNVATWIEAYHRFGQREVNEFIMGMTAVRSGEHVVDLCCGTGKQSIPFAGRVGPVGHVVGLDVTPELLERAREHGAGLPQLEFRLHDCNQRLPFEDASKDLASCCFAIYYVWDLEKLLTEVHRILKSKGRFFVIGPADDNNHQLRRLHVMVSGRPEPAKIIRRRQRLENEVLPLMGSHFARVDLENFHNELRFPDVASFLAYYRSTILLRDTLLEPEAREDLARRLGERVGEIVEAEGAFVISKSYLAVLATK
ncbi:MAG: methyltransferase domain-containing protein [Acidobacteria bacterium]|nr:methyltransferase domain-containing protein [Acidobacteriota bacterium]